MPDEIYLVFSLNRSAKSATPLPTLSEMIDALSDQCKPGEGIKSHLEKQLLRSATFFLRVVH